MKIQCINYTRLTHGAFRTHSVEATAVQWIGILKNTDSQRLQIKYAVNGQQARNFLAAAKAAAALATSHWYFHRICSNLTHILA